MKTENKNTYFVLDLKVPEEQRNERYKDQLEDSVDLVSHSMGANNELYKFIRNDEGRIIYFFKTDKRKRKGQLTKFCERHLLESQEYNAKGISKPTLEYELNLLKQKPEYNYSEENYIFTEYNGEDIEIFNKEKNWFEWQKDVYKLIFEKNGKFKKPHPRHIYSLIDIKGNSGKSSFFKWLFCKYPNNIGRIGYGTAAQLRSSAVNIGTKKLYVIDLARSKSKEDKQEDLLSVLEDLKNGLLTNAMYGSGKTLLMPPPHIIVSSNYILKYDLLSEDRWQVFQIKKNKKLGPVNELLRKSNSSKTIKKA